MEDDPEKSILLHLFASFTMIASVITLIMTYAIIME